MTDSKPSKTERKREQHALHELGEYLIALSDADLATLALDDKLHRAIRMATTIKSHGALRRQKQLIRKLMRDGDPVPIRAAIARLTADDVKAKRLFAAAERWRDRIVDDGSAALDAFAAETGSSVTDLRRLQSDLEAALGDRAEKTIRREIFRRVHEILGKILR